MASDDDDPRWDDTVRAAYRAPRTTDAEAEARTRARVLSPARRGLEPGTNVLRAWLVQLLFGLRPAVAGVVLMTVFLAGTLVGAMLALRSPTTSTPDHGAPPVRTAALEADVPTTFVLRAPGATRVSVAGDFNNWDADATPMRHSGSGDLWIVSVALPRGVHLYSFVLDGAEWRPDPAAPLAADAAFGSHNSVVVVDGAKEL